MECQWLAGAASSVVLSVLGACSGATDGDSKPDPDADLLTEMAELEGIVEGSVAACDSWDRSNDPEVVLSSCRSSTGINLVWLEPALDEPVEQLLADRLRGDKCIAVELWDLDTEPAQLYVWFTWNEWVVGVSPGLTGALAPVLEGPGLSIRDPYPAGVEPDRGPEPGCDPEKYGLPDFSASEGIPTDPPTSSGLGDDDCLEMCSWTMDDVVHDLSLILCASQDPNATLTDDITDMNPLQVEAERILVCANGGSNDLSGLGVVHLWRDYSSLTGTELTRLDRCEIPGVTVYGGNEGNPGYAVAGVQSGDDVIAQLVEGGATVLCGR